MVREIRVSMPRIGTKKLYHILLDKLRLLEVGRDKFFCYSSGKSSTGSSQTPSDPYENAVAERINGILKQEFRIDKYEQSLENMKIVVQEAIEIYNEKRPHFSNYLLTPNQMHQQNIIKMRTYKTKNSSNKNTTTA